MRAAAFTGAKVGVRTSSSVGGRSAGGVGDGCDAANVARPRDKREKSRSFMADGVCEEETRSRQVTTREKSVLAFGDLWVMNRTGGHVYARVRHTQLRQINVLGTRVRSEELTFSYYWTSGS